MKIFLDTTKILEIEEWLIQGVVDGVTTNPSIMLKNGNKNLKVTIVEIAHAIRPYPVNVEVFTDSLDEMLVQAREFARWANNIVVKVTIINGQGESCLRVIKMLRNEGISVNCTACFSFNQAVLATKAGARYVSFLIGRINDEGNNGSEVICKTRQWLDMWRYETEIIAASMRTTMDVQQAALAGAHVITIPPSLMTKLVDHKYSQFTAQQFVKDGKKAFAEENLNY